MILKDKELDKLIEGYEKKSEQAYRNYQDTGHGRYWNTHKKYEDLADTLKVARDYKTSYNKSKGVISNIKRWAGTVSEMPYYTDERKEQEIKNILNEIIDCAKWL